MSGLKHTVIAWAAIALAIVPVVGRTKSHIGVRLGSVFWVAVLLLLIFAASTCFAYAFLGHKFGIAKAKRVTGIVLIVIIAAALFLFVGYLLSLS